MRNLLTSLVHPLPENDEALVVVYNLFIYLVKHFDSLPRARWFHPMIDCFLDKCCYYF